MKTELYKDKKGEWRWRIVAGNNRIVADSAEGYKNKQDCLHEARIVLGHEILIEDATETS